MDTYTLPAHLAGLSFSHATPGTPKPYIGKCPQCKRTVRILSTQHKILGERRDVRGNTSLEAQISHYTTDAPHARHDRQSGVWIVLCPTAGCETHHAGQRSWLYCRRIDGYTVPEVKCNAKCTGAKGPHCECACGGEHHGSAYALHADGCVGTM